MKDRGEFLLELGCEEIPARMIAHASTELKELLEKHLSAEGLLVGGAIEAFGAPRRLAAMTPSLRLRQENTSKEILGPPKSVAFDNVGEPTRAAQSFALKQGIPLSKIAVVSTPRGEYLAARQITQGRPAREILSKILPRIIQEFSFPRSMYWTDPSGPRFVRPIRWILAVLEGRPVPFSIAGVRASDFTVGHRFLGKARIPVRKFTDYVEKLRRNFVLVLPEERRKKIETQLHALTKPKGLRVHADPALLEQVVYLNEFPTVLLGNFPKEFLELPEEILITVMRDHQKYFAVENHSGALVPHFLAVINLDRDSRGLVQAGQEQVLRARFSDARFFWRSDQKCRLADYLPKLAHVTYESRLGSYRDKVERARALARWIAEQWFSSGHRQADVAGADRACELAKCDLVTEMVREFPELQGVVGGLYAQAQGESDDVAWAVYDHYRPVGLDDAIPRNLSGCIVSLADKLDSLVACYAIGAVPSGSSDPFALRRAALGVVKILLQLKLSLSISTVIAAAARSLHDIAPNLKVSPASEKQVLEFLLDRARYILRERQGFAYDEVNAVFAAGADDLADATRRLAAVKAIRQTKNFAPLAIAFKRIRKILEKAGPGATGDGGHAPAVRVELLHEEAERKLHEAAARVREKVMGQKRAGNYREALEAIAELRPSVDKFFDDVLVMTEEKDIRQNRLSLLAGLLKEFSTIADFSEIVTEGSA